MLRSLIVIAVLVVCSLLLLFGASDSLSSQQPVPRPSTQKAQVHPGAEIADVDPRDPLSDEVLPTTEEDETPESDAFEGLYIRCDASALAIGMIKARQPTLVEGMGYLTLEKKFEREESYAHHAKMMAQYAILIIFDAEGRSHTLQEGRHGIAGSGIRPKDALRAQGVEFRRIHSGGHEYLIPHGDFPDYDEVRRLISEHPRGVPLDELPLEGVIQLCKTALSYRTE